MSNVATINTGEALDAVKQIDASVQDLDQKTQVFKDRVDDVYTRTNMPCVEQILKSISFLNEKMVSVKESSAEILTIMQKYADDVDEIANDTGTFTPLV